MNRLDNLLKRLNALEAARIASEEKKLTFILDDGSTFKTDPCFSFALSDLEKIPEGRHVVKLIIPADIDELSEALYEWIEDIATGRATLDELIGPDDSDILPSEEPEEVAQWPERNHNLIY